MDGLGAAGGDLDEILGGHPLVLAEVVHAVFQFGVTLHLR